MPMASKKIEPEQDSCTDKLCSVFQDYHRSFSDFPERERETERLKEKGREYSLIHSEARITLIPKLKMIQEKK